MSNNSIKIDGKSIVFSATKKAIGYVVKGMDFSTPAKPKEIKGFSLIEVNQQGDFTSYKRQFKIIPNSESKSLKITPNEGRKVGETLNIWLESNGITTAIKRTTVTIEPKSI